MTGRHRREGNFASPNLTLDKDHAEEGKKSLKLGFGSFFLNENKKVGGFFCAFEILCFVSFCFFTFIFFY